MGSFCERRIFGQPQQGVRQGQSLAKRLPCASQCSTVKEAVSLSRAPYGRQGSRAQPCALWFLCRAAKERPPRPKRCRLSMMLQQTYTLAQTVSKNSLLHSDDRLHLLFAVSSSNLSLRLFALQKATSLVRGRLNLIHRLSFFGPCDYRVVFGYKKQGHPKRDAPAFVFGCVSKTYLPARKSLTSAMKALTRFTSTAFSKMPSYLKVVAQTAPSEAAS